MEHILIIHNPSAGNGTHTRQDIWKYIDPEKEKITYRQISEKKWKKDLRECPDIILVAGGDGTVHNVALALLQANLKKAIPIQILPFGTANNIAQALHIPSISIEASDRRAKIQEFDYGEVKGWGKSSLFLEGFGLGIFPELIEKLSKKEKGKPHSNKRENIIKTLLGIVNQLPTIKAQIKVNGIRIKGRFLLIESMNIPYVGPNLELVHKNILGDGFLDLVLIAESQRDMLKDYLEMFIKNRHKDMDLGRFIIQIRTKKIQIKSTETLIHIDDKALKKEDGSSLKIRIHPRGIKFYGYLSLFMAIYNMMIEFN